MACERWWLSCCSVNLLFLGVVAVGFSLAIAGDSGESYYRYNSRLLESQSDEAETLHFSLNDVFFSRRRRSPSESPSQPDVTTPMPILTSSTTVKSNSNLDNVAYSTEGNSKLSAFQPTSSTTSQVNPDVIVSQPLNPATGKIEVVESPKIWPNATMRPTLIAAKNYTQDGGKNFTNEEQENDDITIDKFGDVTNSTLSKNNITKTEEDNHQYYNSTFFVDEAAGRTFWVDMDNHPNVKVNELLSESHRRAATVKLSFDFPFYGHLVRNVTIATGGFLYTGDYVHSWLAATQYIAPLMANFDTRLSKNSYVRYVDNGTAFTVEWEKVVLQEKPTGGEFTFQATLHKNGDIVFVYAAVPLVVEKIQDNLHPVKVGLSDAYIIDRTVFFVRRKTIYEYHRVNFMSQDIRNWTVIYLRALPTCLRIDNCNECLNKTTSFECKWCPNLNRCSTGIDRYKQEWLMKGCEAASIKEGETCPATAATATAYNEHERDHQSVHENVHERAGHVHTDEALSASVKPSQHQAKALGSLESTPNDMKMGVSGIIGILLVVSLVVGLIGWGGYAYRNPHSASGQVLIRYRPSQWSWRRGEARYTAATIHM
ncbi:plexin domain-containing protein 2 isoform X1 [Athalia rosae]|uniref:plexin domain-containing protein 2 isoform X1 n=2 Tax=Athalia rosae TaxID=37344 RepID=UPI002033C506|nr:plexin domain-containing protein 2 isoform X1 [Athalia rosae]